MLYTDSTEPEWSLIDTASWMSCLNNGITLNGIVMPGSHDAGMSQTDHCGAGAQFKKSFVQTQSLNIGQQLQAGSRYLDIRIDYDHGELVTYHRTGDAGCNGQSLASVMDQSISFLQSNNTETFMLKFSHIRVNRGKEREIKYRIDQFLDNIIYRPYIFTCMKSDVNLAKIPLGDCRGKFILVFDYPEHTGVGGGGFRYLDKINRNRPPENQESYDNPNIIVYDAYSNTNSLEQMKGDQLEKLMTYGGLGRDYLFLLSWTLTPNIKNLSSSVEQLSENANAELERLLSSRQLEGSIPNIVYIDYFNKKTAQHIIRFNF